MIDPHETASYAAHRPSWRGLTRFFVLACCISWAIWAPGVLVRLGWIGPLPSQYLKLFGATGPLIAAVIVTAREGGRDALARLARRCTTGGLWLGVGMGLPLALFLLAAALASMVLGEPIDWSSTGRSTELPELPRAAYWLANLACYGFGEELGWRGFALPRLQSRFTALRASVVVGIAWAAWHLPLFTFAEGFSELGPAGALGWLASLIVGSMLLTWIYNSSSGSVAAVALFHAALDVFITSPIEGRGVVPGVMGAALTVGSLVAARVLGPSNLSHRSRVTEPA